MRKAEKHEPASMNTVESMNTKNRAAESELREKKDNTDWQKHSSKQMDLHMETYTRAVKQE